MFGSSPDKEEKKDSNKNTGQINEDEQKFIRNIF